MDHYDPRELIISNKSTNTVYGIVSINDSLNGSERYNSFEQIKPIDKWDIFFIQEIKPFEKLKARDRPKLWDSELKLSKDGYLRLFIISKDSVDKYGWKKIFKTQMHAKKYLFKFPEVEVNSENLEIEYYAKTNKRD